VSCELNVVVIERIEGGMA